MAESKTEPECTDRPLPLFRPEAIASQQQKFYGEILLIRPLSLSLLGWLGVGMAAAVLAFLLLGHYTETVHVAGVFQPAQAAGPANSNSSKVDLYVPERAARFVRRGEVVRLHSSAGTGADQQTAVVADISGAPLSPEQVSAEAGLAVPEPMYRVTLNPSTAPTTIPSGTRAEADLPMGRKPLLSWLFERPGPRHAHEVTSRAVVVAHRQIPAIFSNVQ